MIIQTKVQEGKVQNVRWIEGVVQFGKVRLNVYCFAIDGLLIDTGAPRLLNDFKSFFEKIDVDQVLLTHSHEDHVGGAAYLKQTYGVPIYMSPINMKENRKKANYPLYRKFFWVKREPFQAESLEKTVQSYGATWDVIETPGHAIDHLSFLNRNTGQLFSGDLFVQPKTKLILQDESIPTIITSIKHVLTYDFEEIFCCHAGYVKNGREMLQRKLHYLETIRGKIEEMDKKGLDEKEIRSKIFEKRYPITYLSLGEWDSLHIIRSVLKESRNEILS